VTEDATASTLPAPERPTLPDLDIVRWIGSGGFGQVWLATNRVTGRLVAVKTVPFRSADARDRAGRETASLIRYEAGIRNQHPNLLAIQHVGQTDEVLFYIMDPADDVSGTPASREPTYEPATLDARLCEGALPPVECVRCADQLLAALAHMHAAGLVHRDVKPSNCLFIGGELKLGDFGLSTQAEGSISQAGTPRYMPPDGRMDARADVYAAGLVIYEMLTGQPATSFPRLDAEALRIRNDPNVRALNQLVLRAGQRDPEQRYVDADQMREALNSLRANKKPGRPTRRRLAVAMLAAVALACVLGIVLWPGSEPTPLARHHVNFITEPFEAHIYLDGKRMDDLQGQPYTTPCTIPDLPARVHQVVFRKPGLPDLSIGRVDFAIQREVSVKWPDAPSRSDRGPD